MAARYNMGALVGALGPGAPTHHLSAWKQGGSTKWQKGWQLLDREATSGLASALRLNL